MENGPIDVRHALFLPQISTYINFYTIIIDDDILVHPSIPPSTHPSQLKAMSGGLMFALGITWCICTEYVLLRAVHILPYLYVAQIVPLLIYRGITYYKQHWVRLSLSISTYPEDVGSVADKAAC